ncbi:MAG: carboxypeptidase M32 [Planctomycetota bacterium]|nr:MAG: carboxypeptidase M32 [Planctomycetota bacterium]
MSQADFLSPLLQCWAEIRDLDSAAEILEWDQETQMPAKGQEGRGKVLGTLAALRHEKLTASAMQEALAQADAGAEAGSEAEAHLREARRLVDRAVKTPAALARELAEAKSAGLVAWQAARKASDFSIFQPALERLLDLRRRQASCVMPEGSAFDAMLDEFEPGAKQADLEPLFQELIGALVPLIQTVAEGGQEIDLSPVQGNFPPDRQLAFAKTLIERMGFDFEAGRLDLAAHPFCIGFHPGDVRLTWRYQEDDIRPALFGLLHEAGHGMYEQGLPAESRRLPIGNAVSLGVHESQSRLWENRVGRGRSFWQWALPLYRQAFPDKAGVEAESMHRALHQVKPSLIRVEADQVTYDLHIAVRFQIEKGLFEGDLEVADLPVAWNDLYEQILGIRPSDDAHGVLQDIHWSMGMFGYFPTYSLGNLLQAQLYESALADLPDLELQLAQGEFSSLLDWLRRKVHRPASRYSVAELVKQATGKALGTEDYLRYIRGLVAETYRP